MVVPHPATLVTLGDLRNPVAILMLLGFMLIAALNFRRILGGTLIGILVVTAIGLPLGLTEFKGVVDAAIAGTHVPAARLLAHIGADIPDCGVLDPVRRRLR